MFLQMFTIRLISEVLRYFRWLFLFDGTFGHNRLTWGILLLRLRGSNSLFNFEIIIKTVVISQTYRNTIRDTSALSSLRLRQCLLCVEITGNCLHSSFSQMHNRSISICIQLVEITISWKAAPFATISICGRYELKVRVEKCSLSV